MAKSRDHQGSVPGLRSIIQLLHCFRWARIARQIRPSKNSTRIIDNSSVRDDVCVRRIRPHEIYPADFGPLSCRNLEAFPNEIPLDTWKHHVFIICNYIHIPLARWPGSHRPVELRRIRRFVVPFNSLRNLIDFVTLIDYIEAASIVDQSGDDFNESSRSEKLGCLES